MTKPLTPREVQELMQRPLGHISVPTFLQLARDYLTLWDRNKEIEEQLKLGNKLPVTKP